MEDLVDNCIKTIEENALTFVLDRRPSPSPSRDLSWRDQELCNLLGKRESTSEM